jgi:hypothetical protein
MYVNKNNISTVRDNFNATVVGNHATIGLKFFIWSSTCVLDGQKREQEDNTKLKVSRSLCFTLFSCWWIYVWTWRRWRWSKLNSSGSGGSTVVMLMIYWREHCGRPCSSWSSTLGSR